MVKEKNSLNWRKFRWFKKKFFNVNKSIFLDQRKFYLAYSNAQICLIQRNFVWIRETFFSVYSQKTVSLNQINISLIYGQIKNFSELKKVLLKLISWVWNFWPAIERPGLESQRSRERHFFHRKIFKFFKY